MSILYSTYSLLDSEPIVPAAACRFWLWMAAIMLAVVGPNPRVGPGVRQYGRLDGGVYVGGSDAQSRHAERIEPDAHGVDALAEDGDGGDALQAGDAVLYGRVDEVVEVQERIVVVAQEGVDGKEVARAFVDVDADLFHFLGKLRLRSFHGVLDVDHRHVVVDAGLEDDGAAVRAVVVAGGREVEEVLDAVDLGFQGHRDGLLDRPPSGAPAPFPCPAGAEAPA